MPAVGTGTGMHEITKMSAPIRPRSGLKLGVVFDFFFISKIPFMRNGIAAKYHKAAHLRGSIPSEMCIAQAVRVNINMYPALIEIKTNIILRIFFFRLFLIMH